MASCTLDDIVHMMDISDLKKRFKTDFDEDAYEK